MKTIATNHHYRHASAFTLIELLVVLAIIGVLLALIFPIVEKIGDSRRNVGCLSNLRQLVTATSLYMADHNMTYPHHYKDSLKAGDRIKQWYLPLIGFRNAPYQVEPYYTVYIEHGRYGVKAAPFFCMQNPNFRESGQQAWTNYAMNARLIGKKASDFVSSKVIYADSNFRSPPALWYVLNGPASGEWNRYIPVHGNHSNFAFTDGSVRSVFIADGPNSAPDDRITKDWFQ